ncbi:MAG TPA: hypothetical protein VEH78_08110 [Pseudolabrys sp.]|nr:hypothetical protein [Pseudolabrys sp.]
MSLLRDAANSMRQRVLRVSRTLAGLDAAEHVARVHLAETLSCRVLADDVRRAA